MWLMPEHVLVGSMRLEFTGRMVFTDRMVVGYIISMYKNVVVRPHWSIAFPDAVRGLLREVRDDAIKRVMFCAGIPTALVVRKSGVVESVVCNPTDAERTAAALQVYGTGWIPGTIHRVTCSQVLHDGTITVSALTIHIREHIESAARCATPHG